MTPDESQRVLLAMSQAWPTKVSDPTLRLWANRLTRLEFTDAIAAIDRLMDTSKYWPAWSELHEMYAAVRRAARPVWELEPVRDPVSPERVEELVRGMRTMLRRA